MLKYTVQPIKPTLEQKNSLSIITVSKQEQYCHQQVEYNVWFWGPQNNAHYTKKIHIACNQDHSIMPHKLPNQKH